MFEISNYYEQLVRDYLWKRMQSETQPPSQPFLEDVACLALNQLPTRYVRHAVDFGSHLTDEDFTTMDKQVAEAVEAAIRQVKVRPRDRD